MRKTDRQNYQFLSSVVFFFWCIACAPDSFQARLLWHMLKNLVTHEKLGTLVVGGTLTQVLAGSMAIVAAH